MSSVSPASSTLRKWQIGLFVVGLLGLALCALTVGEDATPFNYAWLVGFLVIWEASLGSLGMLMLHHLAGGRWGRAARPALEVGTSLLPVSALAFLPIAMRADSFYPWAGSEAFDDPILAGKAVYLNVEDFRIRAAFYFAVWLVAWLLLAPPWRRTRTDNPPVYPRLSALGLVLLVLTASFAAIDWVMSLEPHWFSSIYGAIYVISSAALAMALSVFAVSIYPGFTLGLGTHSASVRADLGSLLLAMLMVWAYFTFSQFLIIWSADLPEENFWYLKRTTGGWELFPVLIVLAGFFLPFFSLLSVYVKHHPWMLAAVALLIVVAQVAHIIWMVAPATYAALSDMPWQIPLAALAMPCVWAGFWLVFLNRRPEILEPVHVR